MKATQALLKRSSLRRLPLTTKQGPHDFYKGNRTGKMGSHTIYGGFKVDYDRVRTYMCPDLNGFHLTPYVARTVERYRDSFVDPETQKPYSPSNGKAYLRAWKDQGGYAAEAEEIARRNQGAA